MTQTPSPLPARMPAPVEHERCRVDWAAANRGTAGPAIAAGFGARDMGSIATFLWDHPAPSA